MPKPSVGRAVWGRFVDSLLPGHQYNAKTGELSNVGRGWAGFGMRMAANAVLGPAGAAASPFISKWVDKNNYLQVQPEQIGLTSSEGFRPGNVGVTQPAVGYDGPGAQTPGNVWQAFMGGEGSKAGFGNTQFGNGNAMQPGGWQPSSTWGETVAAPTGSNLTFGNNVGAVTGSGAGSGGQGFARGGGGMPAIVGGNAAGSSVLDIWRGRYDN